MRGACARAPLTGPALGWPFCDVIGVYRNLMYVPQGGKRAISWLKAVEKRATHGSEASGFWCGSVPRMWGMVAHMGTRNHAPK